MKRRNLNVVLMVATLVCTGQSGACYDETIRVAEHVQRSRVEVWETRELSSIEAHAEVPLDLCRFVDEPEFGVGIGLHTLPRMPGVVDDKQCLLQVTINRFDSESFNERQAQLSATPDEDLWAWMLAFHKSISRLDENGYTYYRYDHTCDNGDVLSAMVKIRRVFEDGVSLYDREDAAIVGRLLNSISCTR